MTPREVSRSLEEKYGLTPSPGLVKYAEMKRELAEIQSRLTEALEARQIPLELAETLFAVMRVEREGVASPSELAKTLGLPATTISSRLRRMEDLGWVTRELDPLDRRALHVKLLDAGIKTAKSAWAIYDQVLNHLVDKS